MSIPVTEQQHGQCRTWPRHVGLLNDYLRIPYANGSSFASQFIYRELLARGQEVTVMGPKEVEAAPHELPDQHVQFPSLPLRSHPGVYLALPGRAALRQAAAKKFDVTLAQTSNAFLDLATWLRIAHNVPSLVVNTVHLPSAANVILPDSLLHNRTVRSVFFDRFIPWVESLYVQNCNLTDGLIVLSESFEEYWRKRGVTVPIHVIPRAVEPKIFDCVHNEDPFPATARRGGRLLVVCRHTREKEIERLLEIFARWIAPSVPEATLTLVGDGPDHDTFKDKAEQLGIADRTFFPGEFPVTQIPTYYAHADLFVYTSLSETYGQVISEALWCGLPVVALHDGMGVSSQIRDGETGVLVRPGPDRDFSDWRFGSEVVALLRNRSRRFGMAEAARTNRRREVTPERVIDRYYEAFDSARRHCAETQEERKRISAAGKLAHWSWINVATAAFGMLRAPAVVNRHGRKQPSWEAFENQLASRDSGLHTAIELPGEEGPARVGA